MRRREAFKDLIKTLIIAMAIGAIPTIFFVKDMYLKAGLGAVAVSYLALTFILGGIVSGWSWADNLVVATGPKGLILNYCCHLS